MRLLVVVFQNGAWSCLEEATWAECPISNGKHHASGSKAHDAWCTADDSQVRRRRTSIFVKSPSITKYFNNPGDCPNDIKNGTRSLSPGSLTRAESSI